MVSRIRTMRSFCRSAPSADRMAALMGQFLVFHEHGDFGNLGAAGCQRICVCNSNVYFVHKALGDDVQNPDSMGVSVGTIG